MQAKLKLFLHFEDMIEGFQIYYRGKPMCLKTKVTVSSAIIYEIIKANFKHLFIDRHFKILQFF